MKKLIKNCQIVGPGGIAPGNLYVREGKIAAITEGALGDELEVEEVIDAGGLYAIPGVVDEHVHMMDPGHTDREDFITGSGAAAVGGITTVMEHHRTEPPVYDVAELEKKIDYLADRSLVDFGLKGGGAPDNVADLKAMWQDGVTGFKTFTCNLHGVRAMLPGALEAMFREVASFDGTILIHCEEDSLVQAAEERLHREGRTDYHSHTEWRSLVAETLAVTQVIDLVRETGARVIIAHVSHPTLLERIAEARREGHSIYAETCPHYFYLSEEDLMDKGPWVKFAPAVREKEAVALMRKKLDEGLIHTIGSDHCPYPYEEKAAGEENIWNAPNGIPGVETSLPLMLNLVNQQVTSLTNLVKVMCENPARMWGLYPRKGVLQVGADADIVLVDMDRRMELRNETVVAKCGWTPYHGLQIQGLPVKTFVRGELVADERQVVGRPGHGQYLRVQRPPQP